MQISKKSQAKLYSYSRQNAFDSNKYKAFWIITPEWVVTPSSNVTEKFQGIHRWHCGFCPEVFWAIRITNNR